MKIIQNQSTSPDGKWFVEVLIAEPNPTSQEQRIYSRMTVTTKDGKDGWLVSGQWEESGLGMSFPDTFVWSRDGRYLYFYNHGFADGCDYFPFNSGLTQLDLLDGKLYSMNPFPLYRPGVLSISPDVSTLAYLSGNEVVFHPLFQDLPPSQATESRIPFPTPENPSWDAGALVWSPDGKTLAFTLVLNLCAAQEDQATTIVIIDRETASSRILIKEDPRLFITRDWPEPDRLLVTDLQGSRFYIDIRSGALAPAPPASATPTQAITPTPTGTPTPRK